MYLTHGLRALQSPETRAQARAQARAVAEQAPPRVQPYGGGAEPGLLESKPETAVMEGV